MSKIKIGHGFDVHTMIPGDGLMLGGVNIPHSKAFVAHSDGDVLIHALCDALLGALGRGDIGALFPDTDAAHANRNSREFLQTIKLLMDEADYQLGNADITIVAQAPKMAPHIPMMKNNLATDLNARFTQINIKATTTEKLGYAGREEGVAVHAVVLLESQS